MPEPGTRPEPPCLSPARAGGHGQAGRSERDKLAGAILGIMALTLFFIVIGDRDANEVRYMEYLPTLDAQPTPDWWPTVPPTLWPTPATLTPTLTPTPTSTPGPEYAPVTW